MKEWRERLREAIERDRRSGRQIGTDAGLSINFVSQVLTSDKSPTVDNLLKLCEALCISPVYVLTGEQSWAALPKRAGPGIRRR